MNHQITLEELGIISVQEKECCHDSTDRSKYALFCGGCICLHCANSVECSDNWKQECMSYKITETYAEATRKRFRVLKQRE